MDNITPASVGRLIRDARKQHGMTQNQLAEILKTSQSAIHRVESGTQNLSLAVSYTHLTLPTIYSV